jgi:hypothetical protein
MLTRKQKQVARALYDGQMTEEEVLREYKINRALLERWQGQPGFQLELDRLCEAAGRETRLVLARFGPIAALRLAELVGSDKPDVARRAALDLVDRCLARKTADEPAETEDEEEMTDEQVRSMLVHLAEGFTQK